MSAWDAWAGGIVLFGGFAVLAGSIAQAQGDLLKYQHFRATITEANARSESEVTPTAEPQARAAADPVAKVHRGFLSRQFLKVLSKREVKDFLAEQNPKGWGRLGQIALLILIALWRPVQVADEEHRQAEQALNDAAGWSLILLGSLLAVVAGGIQFVLLIVRGA
jgi:hypothetical protein